VADIDPGKVGICHCTDCQHLTATVYRVSVQVEKENITFSGGAPKIYVKTAESGNQRAHGFCPECGTPLYATSVNDRKLFSLRVGTIRQKRELRPVRQQWCRSALPWAQDISGLPKVEMGSRQPVRE
jgi:hypothetical protein